MSSGTTLLEEQKARLIARCCAERAVLESTCMELQQSMHWWDLGYSVASSFAPRVKFILPALAVVAGSQFGSLGKVGSVVTKLIAGYQFFRKAQSLYGSLNVGSFLGRKKTSIS
jgi:hypothetical protein